MTASDCGLAPEPSSVPDPTILTFVSVEGQLLIGLGDIYEQDVGFRMPTVNRADAATAAATNDVPPRRQDLKFLSVIDCSKSEWEAVCLLAAYADNSAYFFHDRGRRHAVECLASARLFAEYALTYIAKRERIELIADRESDRASFYEKAKGLRDALRAGNYSQQEREIINSFPDYQLRQIWEKAGDAVHPPKGISANEIREHKSNYQNAAEAALKDVLKIGRWLERRYGRLPWYKQVWRALVG